MENPELVLIVHFLITALCAGLVGTSAMTLLMLSITKAGLTNADMVRAIGSKFTGSLDSAFLVGGILHFISGTGFAALYTLAFNFLEVKGPLALFGVGIGFGFLHGFVLSFILVTTVAEHHPLPEFRDAGMGVAFAHLIGHVVFGGTVGLMVGLSGFSL